MGPSDYDLKPCPFCGLECGYVERELLHTRAMAHVACGNCWAQGPLANFETLQLTREDQRNIGNRDDMLRYVEREAVKRWNEWRAT